MKHVKIKISNLVTWEKIDNNMPDYIPVEGKKELDDELKPIVNMIIENTINDEKKKYISIPDIIRKIEWPELASVNVDVTRKRIVDSITKRYSKKFGRFLKENEEWKDVFDSQKANGGGYRLKNFDVLNNDEISKGNIVIPQESTILYKKSADISVNSIDDEHDLYDDSEFIGEDPPDGTKCIVGEAFRKKWTIRNAGNVVWHNRTMRCDPLPLHVMVTPELVNMPDIKPGEEFTLEVTYTADDEGRYCSNWKICDEKGNKSFPHKTGVGVTLIVESDKTKNTEMNQTIRTNNVEDSVEDFRILGKDIADCAELIECSYNPSIEDAIKCKLKNKSSFELNYNFGSKPVEAWPEFISAVFRFYDVVNMYELYSFNKDLKLHFEIDSCNESIKMIQIEFQTYNNQVIRKPYVVEFNSKNVVVDIPLSYFSKDIYNLKQFRNLCFVIKNEYFLESKGTVMINRIRFI